MLDRHHSDLEILRAHRGALNGRIVRLQAERNRLHDAETAETEALKAIGELGRAEVAAVREWASTGSPGPAPKGDAARRAELTRDLVAAEAASAAARGAGAGVDQELADITREAAGLAEQIERAAVVELIELFNGGWSDVQIRAVELRATIARAFAVLHFLRDRADEHRTRGREAEAMAIFRQVERLSTGLALSVEPSAADVFAAATVWERHFEGLLR